MDDVMTSYKLSILYLLDNISWPVSTAGICDVLLEKLYTNFFHLQQALVELEEAEMINRETIGTSTYYSLTSLGKEGFVYLEKELAMDLRKAIMERIHELKMDTHRTLTSSADMRVTVTGGYSVRCLLLDGKDSVIDLTLMVPGPEAAKAVCAKWPLRSQLIYEKLVEELL